MEAHGEEGEAPSPPPGPGGGVNVFANDGSFLELCAPCPRLQALDALLGLLPRL